MNEHERKCLFKGELFIYAWRTLLLIFYYDIEKLAEMCDTDQNCDEYFMRIIFDLSFVI